MPRVSPVKQELQEMDRAVEANTNLLHNCKIGGMPSKLIIDESCQMNIMSRALFRKLREEKWVFFTSDMVPLKVGDIEFRGQFTTKIEMNGSSVLINFYVQDGTTDVVVINKRIAESLKIEKQ